jgi:RNA polymerase sigma factor (sigma-70 family)
MATNDDRERGFQDIVAANLRRILAIARSYAPARDRQDLCQEILLQMWKGFASFQGRSAPSTWVYRVALNTAITFRRKNGRRVEPNGTSWEESGIEPATSASPGREILILEEFMKSLGKIDCAVFLLYLEDLSYRDISEVTGLTESHVGVRISRLKRAFERRYL